MPVWDLALAIRVEAEQFAHGKAEFPKCSRYGNADIWGFCKTAGMEAVETKSEDAAVVSTEKKEEAALGGHGTTSDEEVENKLEEQEEDEKSDQKT
eukprot:m.118696 g.118696  ORF g.118696 m.118696 type:complete len:96 (+) comp37657_c0_seq5:640-927(+)